MQNRQSFKANGKMNACRSASRSQTKEKPPVVEKHAGSRQATPGRQPPAANPRQATPGGQLPAANSR